MRKIKLFILGLDGADWNTINPILDKLPNIKKVVENGVTGPLESCYPPITPMAFTTFMTGNPPENHGVLNFWKLGMKEENGMNSFYNPVWYKNERAYEKWYEYDDHIERAQEPPIREYFNEGDTVCPVIGFTGGSSMKNEFVNSSWIKGETIFYFLNDAGFRTGIINVPVTYPPLVVDGYCISGVFAGNHDKPFTHPKELKQELFEYIIDPQLTFAVIPTEVTHELSEKRKQLYFEMCCATERSRWANVKNLMETHPTDVVCMVIGSTDRIAHVMFGDERVTELWKIVDEIFGEILERCESLIVFSDHGMCHVSDKRGKTYLKTVLARPQPAQIVGVHAVNGVFMALGSKFRAGKVKNAKIQDITPTILKLFNISKPKNMEGTSLEVFK